MRFYNLTPQDVTAAIQSQNMEVSAGSVGASPAPTDEAFQFTLVSKGNLNTAQEFSDIIIRSGADGLLRLKDVARTDLGSISYSATTFVSGHEAALLGIKQLPGANALSVSKNSRAELERLAQYFPPGVKYNIVLDSSDFVTASIDDVLVTFVETTLIVMIVILLFLQNWRAVVIPMITIPVSLIATFAVMKIMGFTINTLTLFGLVLAIAIVVDDAIVVVEDCSRLVDAGKLSRRQAAEKAMEELTGPVIGEVLVLLSVFIPTAFVSGITGELYKQFALTIAVSTAFSGFNALTLTPALCALFLTPRKKTKFFIYRWFDKGYQATENLYKRCIHTLLKRPWLSTCGFIAIAVFGFILFLNHPTSYVPQEDQGYFMSSIQLPQGASLERTQKVVNRLSDMIRKEIPEVENVMSISGLTVRNPYPLERAHRQRTGGRRNHGKGRRHSRTHAGTDSLLRQPSINTRTRHVGRPRNAAARHQQPWSGRTRQGCRLTAGGGQGRACNRARHIAVPGCRATIPSEYRPRPRADAGSHYERCVQFA